MYQVHYYQDGNGKHELYIPEKDRVIVLEDGVVASYHSMGGIDVSSLPSFRPRDGIDMIIATNIGDGRLNGQHGVVVSEDVFLVIARELVKEAQEKAKPVQRDH